MAKRTLLEIFKRYSPSDDEKRILLSASKHTIRVNREQKMIEVNAFFTTIIEKELLYEIEKKICEVYELNSMIIFPSYPSDLFDYSYISELVKETERRGAVCKGFFDGYTAVLDGDNLVISISYADSGVGLLHDAKTPEIMSDILQNEFGININVQIRRDSNYVFDLSEYESGIQAQSLDILQEEDKKIALSIEKRSEEFAEKLKSVYGKNAEDIPVICNGHIIKTGYCTLDILNSRLIFGEEFDIEPLPITALQESMRSVVVAGVIFALETRLNRRGTKVFLNFSVTDYNASINVKAVLDIDQANTLTSELENGKAVVVFGDMDIDKYDNESYILPVSIMTAERVLREDNADEKRVELHIHSQMSAMDATIPPDVIVRTAHNWGHKAVAITDHGNVQGFPEAMLAAESIGMKVLYGMEGYYVDDTARAVYGESDASFNDEFIVFDIETTGLSANLNKIIEIGAVRIKDGEVTERFLTFVDPETPIPSEITKLTGIDDKMVAGAPLAEEAVKEFIDFAGDRLLIAHNAGFDISFIRKNAEEYKIPFNNPYLDTVALSRYVNSELKNHRLDTLVKYFKLGDFEHHRAAGDAEVLAQIFYRMVEKLRGEGVDGIESMLQTMAGSSDPLKLRYYHIIIFAKNKIGLKNLYKIVSKSYLDYFYRYPRIPKTVLNEYREGLIIGSACEAGELFSAIVDNRPQSDLKEIAEFYDYLEIQPIGNNRFLIDEGKAVDDEQLQDFNRKVVKLGQELGKPVVATCDAHFLEKHDEIYRKILLSGMKMSDSDRDIGLYFRTTDEMLAEFDYLGNETAREVVIKNTNLIADMIEDIRPIPKGTFTPKLEGAEETLKSICHERAHNIYGNPLPDVVCERLEKELTSIIKHGFAVLYIISQKLVEYSESEGYLVGSRGSVGSSFVASLAGISEVNPLPPHYYCIKCQYTDFDTGISYGSGFDLPDKKCPKCGTLLEADGHDIPFETFLGFYGDKSPDIDLNFSGEVQAKVHKYTEQLFGSENVFRAGTLGTLADKTAFGFVAKYVEGRGLTLNKAEINRLIAGCVGAKRTTGQHPGGIIVVPREYDIYDFTPVQHPADKAGSEIITTHFAFTYLHETILKLDELGHDVPTKYKIIEQYTNTSVMDVPMNDSAVYELFLSTKSLGVSPESIGCQLGTFGLPEMGTGFIQQVLLDAKPKNFTDLMQISGLTHGKGVWLGNAQELIKQGICDISKVIGTRDGIMLDLIRYGLDNSLAFKIMEDVRRGKGLKPEYEKAMLESGVPAWYITSCKKIKYMFPKAHAAAYVMSAIRLGWYKVHMPLEFYAAFFTAAPGGFNSEIVLKGKSHVVRTITEIEKQGNEASQKDVSMLSTLQLVNESLARGIKYLPVDLYKSDAHAFLPEDKKIRVPLSSLPGLGETAAERIAQVCAENKLFSIEELKSKAGLSKTVIEILQKNNALDGLNETNQLTFF